MCENYAGKLINERDFCMLFCFCETFSRNNKSVELFHLLLKNGLVIAQDELWVYEYIIFRDIYLHNLNGVAENVSILTAPGFKVKLIFHHRPAVLPPTGLYLLIVIILLVTVGKQGIPSGTPPASSDSIDVNIGSTVSFFNRIIGWQRSARSGHNKTPEQRHYAAFTGVLNLVLSVWLRHAPRG